MAAVIGDLEAADDLPHEPSEAATYNDSAYVNAFDTDGGGFVRIGNRVNEGYAEVTLCWFRPDGTVLFDYQRPAIHSNDAFAAGGLEIEILAPLERVAVRYDGTPIHLDDPRALADPAEAFAAAPRREVSLNLDVTAIGPALGSRPADFDAEEGSSFLTGHLEQHVAATGAITVDGGEEAVTARGLRDRSWGPRVWQALSSYRWLNVAFDDDLLVMATRVVHRDGAVTCDGAVIEDSDATRIDAVTLEGALRRRDGGVPGEDLTARLRLTDGRTRVLTGTIETSVPLRNRRDGHLTRIREGLTRYRMAGAEALGIAESLDQMR